MAGRFKNTSKYRHISGKEAQRTYWYPDLIPSTNTEAHIIEASSSKLAVVWQAGNGGSVALLNIAEQGKRKGNPHLIHAHSGQIYDLAFSPFDQNLLCTGSEDTTVKFWKVPEVVSADISQAELTLSGHSKRVDSIRFHPSASNVVATGSYDKTVKLWDITSAEAKLELDHPDQVNDISWNYDGSLLATTSRDKKLRIWDPRSNVIVRECIAHEGVKATRLCWLGDLNHIVTTGFSKFRDRQLRVYSANGFQEPVFSSTIDSSTGILTPRFDPDSNLLFLAGRGDSGIKFFECSGSKPWVTALNATVSNTPQKDICMLPKIACDVMDTEIARVFKLTANAVIPISFKVPRKLKINFADDLFPDTASDEPALSAQEWFGGSNANPKLKSLDPASTGVVQKQAPRALSAASQSRSAYASKESTPQPATISEGDVTASEYFDPTRKVDYAGDRVLEDEKVVEEYVPKQVSIVRKSKLRHINSKTWKRDLCYTNVHAYNQSNDTSSIKANPTYFAVPWSGPGGRLAVIPLARPGKLPDKLGMLETGDVLLDFDFSPFNDNIISTGTENGDVKVWKIAEGLMDQTQNQTQSECELIGHNRKITTLNFHPVVSNVLFSSSSDNTVRLWDVEHGKEAFCASGLLKAYAQHVVFNYDGSRVCVSCKDKTLAIFDPRTNTLAAEKLKSHDGAKGVRLAWLGNSEKLLSVGFSRGSTRQFSIWDTRNFSTALSTTTIDTCSGVINPIYDEDTNVVFFAGRGDGEISIYELEDEKPFQHFVGKHQTSTPQMDVVPLPKSVCDFRNTEILRALKLSTTAVEVITFSVPRTRKEYFQDDIFPPTRDGQPSLQGSSWLAGENRPPSLKSLQPSDMKPVSQAPKIVREKKYTFNPNAEPEKDFVDMQKDVLDKFYTKMAGFDAEAVGQHPDQNEGTNWDEWEMADY